jgi:dethiobiotin synthetase
VPVIFVAGIDTGIGKTVATGLMARYLMSRQRTVITQKLVQTGGQGLSDDILTHRRLMAIDLTAEDRDGLTCPYVLLLPASPHLAAREQNVLVDPAVISLATDRLAACYEYVLVEGVGGIEVPLSETLTTLDYLAQRNYPLVVVSSSRLGSINHTLLTLRAAAQRGLEVRGIAYRRHADENPTVAEDSRRVFAVFLERNGFPATIVDVPWIQSADRLPEIDFAAMVGR